MDHALLDKTGRIALVLAAGTIGVQAARLAWVHAPAGRWLGLDIALQCWSMCVLALLAARGKISLAGWGWCALAAALLSIGDPFAHHVHPWLMVHELYPPFWGRGNDPQQSPQYARLLAWSVSLVLAWARALFSAKTKPRTDPMSAMALLAASSVLATSLLFHIASLWIVQERQSELESSSRLAMSAPSDEAFMGHCRATGALCGSGKLAAYAAAESMPTLGREQALASLSAVEASGPGAFAFWRQATDVSSFNRLPSMTAAAGVGPQGQPRLWVDTKSLRFALELAERVFALLALPAHLVWLWGAISLGWWHRRLMLSRASSHKAH